jgi:DNA-binding response OmpR family regulator
MFKKVLLIEDDPQILALYSIPFESGDFDLLSETGGRDGFAKAKAFLPDIILLDIIMKDLNGIETLKKLKNEEDTKNIPVVMLTNVADQNTIDDALKLGALEYWEKSKTTPKEVLHRVKAILKMT